MPPMVVCSDLNIVLSDEFIIPSYGEIGAKIVPEGNGRELLR